ncbi:hypothetical protein ACJIZ3_016530 [Penstemon smallii]|uniref:Kinesin motor domain-containing protein n=1 Tax=Penstemon smallii TaxID=265156 RepID=A0ABD3SU07_9LAMI
MERIHVSVRPRPLSPEYAKTSPWRISGNSIFIPNSPSKFEFDHVFGEACKTEDVYRARTGDIVAAAVRGFNGTVFAYGQTSSGKTHTMRGSNSELGVIPLAVHDIFNIIQQEIDREFSIRMSYMEIYNEEINDLLAPDHRKLQIYESIERGIFVDGLREEIVTSAEQVLQLMACGESRRHIGETNMNVYSSRSHTIFRMPNLGSIKRSLLMCGLSNEVKHTLTFKTCPLSRKQTHTHSATCARWKCEYCHHMQYYTCSGESLNLSKRSWKT